MLESIIFGAVLFGMYILNGSAVIPAMTGACAAAALALAAIVFAVRRNFVRAKDLGAKAAVLALASGLISGAMYLNAGKAARGAERIAAACEEYKEKNGTYPETISKLVPEYLASIPLARTTIMWSHYRLRGERVMYVLDPWMPLAAYYDIKVKKTGFVRMAEMFPAQP